jgi:hypothetical protein
MRVYLCGPMRGCPAWNAAAFDRYAAGVGEGRPYGPLPRGKESVGWVGPY